MTIAAAAWLALTACAASATACGTDAETSDEPPMDVRSAARDSGEPTDDGELDTEVGGKVDGAVDNDNDASVDSEIAEVGSEVDDDASSHHPNYCGHAEALNSAIASILDREESTVSECGCVSGVSCWFPPYAPAPNRDSVVSCILQHAEDCLPAMASYVSFTIEGDPLWHAWVVAPTGGGCSVYSFLDTTRDSYGTQGVLRWRCAGLVAAAPSCAPVSAIDCEERVDVTP